MTQLRRTAAVARAYDVACEIKSPSQAGELWPAIRTDDLRGAVWLPGDGKTNPTDLTQALARGARSRSSPSVPIWNSRCHALAHTGSA